ncbi:MAG: M14 family zinc carboxypeptidase [Chitinophagales bacterium]
MRFVTLCLLLLCISHTIFAQNPAFIAPTSGDMHQTLHLRYQQYKEHAITDRRFKQADIIPMIEHLKQDPLFAVSIEGQSVEGRNIYMVKLGHGRKKVLMWSQMHGNEPTATMALLDIFNFFRQQDDLMRWKNELLDSLTLYFIPMLNPDGTERFERRNALDIDLNRDAVRLQSPEAQILKRIHDQIHPDFAFNLHDQTTQYSAGRCSSAATLSFLAPSFNYANDINANRFKAMQVVSHLNKILQVHIPRQVARYDDEYEPRAFGDNMQKWGTSAILIEAGGYHQDYEKQYNRQLHFVTLLQACETIAKESYRQETLQDYFAIPENEKTLFHLLLRNVVLEKEGKEYVMDIAFKSYEAEYNQFREYYFYNQIEDMGDLSVFHGYQELNAKGLKVVPGLLYPQIFDNAEDLKYLDMLGVLKQGYTNVKVREVPNDNRYHQLPIRLTSISRSVTNKIELNRSSDFLLQAGDGTFVYAVVNGFLFDLQETSKQMYAMPSEFFSR